MHRLAFRVLTSPEGWYIMLFSRSTLISQLCLHFFEKLKYYTLGNGKSLPVLYHFWIHCWAHLYTHSFIELAFISYLVSVPFCSSRKLPRKVQPDGRYPSTIHSLKQQCNSKNFVCVVECILQRLIEFHSQNCFFL